jgi:hypothetical protein
MFCVWISKIYILYMWLCFHCLLVTDHSYMDVFRVTSFGVVSSSLFFPVPVCAITASGVPGGTFVSMNRFNTLCG